MLVVHRASHVLLALSLVVFWVSAVAIAYRVVGVAERIALNWARSTANRLDDQLIPLVARIARVLVVALGALFVMQNQGLDVGSILTGLGIGGLAVALAAKDSLENFFGSIMIFVDRPFQIGDWIVVGDVEGVVEEVGLRSTRVRTFSKSLISVPNGKLVVSNVNNMGLRTFRRVTTTIGLVYATPREKMEAYVARLNQIIQEHPKTWKEGTEIHFKDFGASSLDVMVYFFLQASTWHEELVLRQEILLSFIAAAEEIGVSFAFPSRSLYIEKGEGSGGSAR
jgi:MscS family membrane protein